MDTPAGWTELGQQVARRINYAGVIDVQPLQGLGERYESPDDAVTVAALGYTLEVRNTSSTPVRDIKILAADASEPPSWAAGIEGLSLAPGERTILLRDAAPEPVSIKVSWTNISDVRQSRLVEVPATAAS